MRLLWIALSVVALSLHPPGAAGQPECRVTVPANVEVAAGEFSLADLLAPGACPELVRAAVSLRLGSAPAAGSARVLEGDDVRSRLRKLAQTPGIGAVRLERMRVPERITVRRAGSRASCADIRMQILAALPAQLSQTMVTSQETDCGAAGRIPYGTRLELMRKVWDPVLASWDVSTRCVPRADCVPFLVRVRMRDSEQPIPASSASLRKDVVRDAESQPLVRRGQTVTLLWDQDGIRLVVPAVCLDPGVAGQRVRARISLGGRIVRAVVESAAMLRVAS
jgi:Chaperone for flagella basal body P-ring formation